MKTTNYTSTLIAIADDCPTGTAQVPPERTQPTVARMQFDLLAGAPYRYTSDDVVFTVHAERAGIPEAERPAARERFFARGQPCLRTSPLARRYGWGIHHDGEGRVALVPTGSDEYERLSNDPATTVVRAMRSRRG